MLKNGSCSSNGEAAGQHAAAFGSVQRGEFALQPLRLAAVALAQLRDLRLQSGHAGLAAEGVVAERRQQQPYGHREYDDGGRRGQAARQRSQELSERNDEVVRDAHRGAEKSEHGETLQRVRRFRDQLETAALARRRKR